MLQVCGTTFLIVEGTILTFKVRGKLGIPNEQVEGKTSGEFHAPVSEPTSTVLELKLREDWRYHVRTSKAKQNGSSTHQYRSNFNSIDAQAPGNAVDSI